MEHQLGEEVGLYSTPESIRYTLYSQASTYVLYSRADAPKA